MQIKFHFFLNHSEFKSIKRILRRSQRKVGQKISVLSAPHPKREQNEDLAVQHRVILPGLSTFACFFL